MEEQEDEIVELKQEVVNTTKLADAAHAREQNAQEVIENLRLNIEKLGLEIEQKNKQLAAEKEWVYLYGKKDEFACIVFPEIENRDVKNNAVWV